MRDPRGWIETNVPLIARTVARSAARARLSPQERDDLQSAVWTHLIRDDYRALRQFRGSSAVTTYLRVVVDRVAIDMRIAAWGKWRPSAVARRMGDAAVAFERLVGRDGHSFGEARALLGAQGIEVPLDTELRLAAARQGGRRHFVDLSAASGERACDDPFTTLVRRQRTRRAAAVGARLSRALAGLPASDRVIVRMRHGQGLKVSQIAAVLGLDQKRLYRRLDAIHAGLRASLTDLGVTARDASELTCDDISLVPPVLSRGAGRPGGGSSTVQGSTVQGSTVQGSTVQGATVQGATVLGF